MTNETRLTIIGRLTAAPELRFTASGAAVANFTVASNARKFDRDANEWKDEPPLFMRCSVWREQAENVAESLDKGMGVIVAGVLVQRSYETQSGEKRTVVELQVDEVGPSLRYASAKVTRTQRSGSGGGGGYGGGSSEGGGYSGGGGQGGAGSADDPWATPAQGGGAGGYSDEPPF